MRVASAVIAIVLATPLLLLVLLTVLLGLTGPSSDPYLKAQLALIALLTAFVVSAIVALRGGSLWFLRAIFAITLIGFLMSDPPAGLFEGGIVTLPVFGLLVAGVITSLCARRDAP